MMGMMVGVMVMVMQMVMFGGGQLREGLERGGGVQRAATGSGRVNVLSFDSGWGVRVLGGHDGGVGRQRLGVGRGVGGRRLGRRGVVEQRGVAGRRLRRRRRLVAVSDHAEALPSVAVAGGSHLQQGVGGRLALRRRLINVAPASVVSGAAAAALLRVGRLAAGHAVLRLPVSGEAVGVSERLPAHLAAEELLAAAFVDRLVVGGQVEVVAEGLPAYGAGVEPRRRRRGLRLGRRRRRLLLLLGVGVVRLDVLGVGVVGGGARCLVLAPVLGHATLRIWVKAVHVLRRRRGGHLLQLPFLVEFAVPPEALRVAELLPADAAFVILRP